MIYAENIYQPQVLMIPSNALAEAGVGVLTIRSTTGHSEEYEITAFIASNIGLYAPIAISLPAAPTGFKSSLFDGEYEYELKQDDCVISTGCLQIGEYQRSGRNGADSGITFSQGK